MEALIGALIGAILGFFGAYLKYDAEIRRIRAQYVSANRKAWMNRVIEKIVAYVVAIKHDSSNKESITRLRTELELLLNPTEEDSKIKDKKSRLIEELTNAENAGSDAEESTMRIVGLAKEILSHEWEMVKRNV